MLYENLQETISYIKNQTSFQPDFGIVLGTGLSGLVDDIKVKCKISYKNIPHFPQATVESHRGELIFGTLGKSKVVAMAGRFHYYEGYSAKEITFPIRVLKLLNIKHLFLSNATGGVNPNLQAGEIVLIRDHINLLPDNPLRGENDERLGPRFPDMIHTYNRKINQKAIAIAKANGIAASEGVYLCLQGPNLETPAEYLYFHRIGADVIGMSTVPEVLVARHMGLPVTVFSIVTNVANPYEEIPPATVEEVIKVAEEAAPKLQLVLRELLEEFG